MIKYRLIFGLLLLSFMGIVALALLPQPHIEENQDFQTPMVGETVSLSLYRNIETSGIVLKYFTKLTQNSEVALAILTACDENNLSPIIAFSLAKKESHFLPKALGRNIGSLDRGLFQLNSISYPDLPASAAFNPWINSRLGVSHIKSSVVLAGSLEKGLAAYNAGFSRVKQNLIPNSTRLYVVKIMGFIKEMEEDFFDTVFLESRVSEILKRPKDTDVLVSYVQ